MVQCRRCNKVLQRPTANWTVVFHGNLLMSADGWELEPWGEGDYIDSLVLECECGYEVKVKIKAEDIGSEHLEEAVKKLAR